MAFPQAESNFQLPKFRVPKFLAPELKVSEAGAEKSPPAMAGIFWIWLCAGPMDGWSQTPRFGYAFMLPVFMKRL
jgi:hypothetical protein